MASRPLRYKEQYAIIKQREEWLLMPSKYCQFPRCPNPAQPHGAYCLKHASKEQRKPRGWKERNAATDRERGTAAERGYDHKWRMTRASYLKRHPLCYDCAQRKEYKMASEVHHIIKVRDGGRNYDENLMALCKSCHSKRTARGE